jgi:hypothetical protein
MKFRNLATTPKSPRGCNFLIIEGTPAAAKVYKNAFHRFFTCTKTFYCCSIFELVYFCREIDPECNFRLNAV